MKNLTESKIVTFISEQSLEPINRRIFVALQNFNIQPHVWVPKNKNDYIDSNSVFNVNLFEFDDYHPRKSILPFNTRFISQIKNSSSVIVESDLGSISLLQIVLFKIFSRSKFKLFCSTFENIERYFFNKSFDYLVRLKFIMFITHLFIAVISLFNSKFIDGLFVFSIESEKIHKKKYKQLSIYLIPLGLDQSVFTCAVPRRQVKTIAYMGRVIKEKRPDIVLDLFVALAEKNPGLTLIFQDPRRYFNIYAKSLWERLSSYITKYNINIVNPQHDEMAQILRTIDLLIVPSVENSYFKEQYGRLVVEGKLCGCLVLVSKSGALPEVLSNNELVVESNNLEHWVNKVKMLLSLDSEQVVHLSSSLKENAIRYQTINVQARLMADVI